MPACVPLSNDNIADVNANTERPSRQQGESKLSKIMTCLFWKKKTEVVDMKEKPDKKKKMAVDRSERSRRVLKMESMKAPKARAESDDVRPPSTGSQQMFLPSENPTASFLSYLNPNVRRACSDVIRTTSLPSNRQAREAFAEGKTQTKTRNTNYRGQQAVERSVSSVNPRQKENDRPPKPPERSKSQKVSSTLKPIVVPGITSCSDDDVGYNSENEILDLQDEMRRMNMSQPDMRKPFEKGEGKASRRRREGSISLSEGSDSDGEGGFGDATGDRPPNPSPVQQDTNPQPPSSKQNKEKNKGKAKRGLTKNKSMEEVIDVLYLQTQTNIESIYQNGLENMELETLRSDTVTPETCMRKLEEDLRITSEDELDKIVPGKPATRKPKNKEPLPIAKENNTNGETEIDSLLTEVSNWAKDRQDWILQDGEKSKNKTSSIRENTSSTMKTDDRLIHHVKMTNEAKCNLWINDQNETQTENAPFGNSKANGILTGPRLFRSASRTQTSRKVSFSDKSSSRKSPVTIVNVGDDFDKPKHSSENDHWTSEMYETTTNKSSDRATIDDTLSDFDKKEGFRAKSPDSWLSSVCDYSTLMEKYNEDEHRRDMNDSFETVSTTNNSSNNAGSNRAVTVKRAATEPARAHQIIRQKPIIHAPFRNTDKQFNPLPSESTYMPLTFQNPMIKNTQLRPLPANRPPRPSQSFSDINGRNVFASLSRVDSNSVLKGSRNMNDFEVFVNGNQSQRPFSEIPLRPDHIRQDEGHTSLPLSRPNSETAPTKRNDKIGFGQIMATETTKERKRYARDIVRSFNKPNLPPQDAFIEGSGFPNSDSIERENTNPTRQKRHKVFNNDLIKGGYNYDKHSRLNAAPTTELESASFSPRQRLLANLENSNEQNIAETPRTADLKSASISELSIAFKEGKKNGRDEMGALQNGGPYYYNSLHGSGSDRFQEALKAQQIAGVRHNGTDSVGHYSEKAVDNRNIQSHSLTILNTSSEKATMQNTADRLKRLRTRRDIEMEWLMKDAAETEV